LLEFYVWLVIKQILTGGAKINMGNIVR